MARTASKRRRAPRQPQPLPPPLPPEERSVGQLVAETIRFYQHHFFQTLPLGLSVAALTQLTVAFGHRRVEPRGHPPPRDFDTPTSMLGGGSRGDHPARRAAADRVVHRRDRPRHRETPRRPCARDRLRARRPGLPAGAAARAAARAARPSRTWRSSAGSFRPRWSRAGASADSFRRSFRLARVDFVHAAGGLATLVIVFYVVRLMLALLLRDRKRGRQSGRRRCSPTSCCRRCCSWGRRSSTWIRLLASG